jgi:uncharacterized membrane protein
VNGFVPHRRVSVSAVVGFLLATPADPPAYGPATWELAQWLTVAGYVVAFVLVCVVIWRVARPRQNSEAPPK